MSAVTVDNNLVHYEVLGRGRPVILIHGWFGSWRYWIPTMQQLSTKYRIYAVDLWGFGDTEKDATRYSFAAQVRLLTDFMDKMGIAKAAIVGHALGAAVAITFTRQFPERAPRVMLISPPLFDMGGILDPGGAATRLSVPEVARIAGQSTDASDTIARNPFRDSSERYNEIQQIATTQGLARPAIPSPRPVGADPLAAPLSRQDVPNPLVPLLQTINPKAALEKQLARDPANLEKMRAEVEKMDQSILGRMASSFQGINLAQQLSQLASPVLMLHGREDSFIPPDEHLISQIAACKKDGQFLPFIVPELRHFPMLEHAPKFNRLMTDYLDATDLTNVQMKETWVRQLR